MMTENIKQSLEPQISANTKIMVIGSMPGEESLRRQQYYGHPQNNFWKFVAATFPEIELNLPYEKRLSLLLKRGIGLWDVLQSCYRQGSLDSAIKNMEINDFTLLSAKAPQVCKLLFNGKKAYETFIKSKNVDWAEQNKIELVLMPSTSPANASQTREWKLNLWRQELQNL